jgi:hypothetical protein
MEDPMQDQAFHRGNQQGVLEGELRMLTRLYAWRLQRPLTDNERTVLARRVEKLGLRRVLEIRQELPADALAAWLGDPAAQ